MIWLANPTMSRKRSRALISLSNFRVRLSLILISNIGSWIRIWITRRLLKTLREVERGMSRMALLRHRRPRRFRSLNRRPAPADPVEDRVEPETPPLAEPEPAPAPTEEIVEPEATPEPTIEQ